MYVLMRCDVTAVMCNGSCCSVFTASDSFTQYSMVSVSALDCLTGSGTCNSRNSNSNSKTHSLHHTIKHSSVCMYVHLCNTCSPMEFAAVIVSSLLTYTPSLCTYLSVYVFLYMSGCLYSSPPIYRHHDARIGA